MSMKEEFKTFVMKGNVVDLAVAVVIGGAFGKIVTALVEGVFMPLVGMAVPGGDWRSITVGPVVDTLKDGTVVHAFKLGSVAGAVVDFACISLVVFLVFVKGMAVINRKKEEPAGAPTTKECPACLEHVPLKATRCKHCTSQL